MKNTGIVYHSTERTPTVLAELAGLLPPLSGEQLAALDTSGLDTAPLALQEVFTALCGQPDAARR